MKKVCLFLTPSHHPKTVRFVNPCWKPVKPSWIVANAAKCFIILVTTATCKLHLEAGVRLVVTAPFQTHRHPPLHSNPTNKPNPSLFYPSNTSS